MSENVGPIRVRIEMDDGFEPGPRTAAAIAALAAALDEEHGSGDDVAGFSMGPIRSITFGFSSTAGGSPNVLMGTNLPRDPFQSSASGSPNVLMDPNPPAGGFASSAGGSPNV